jgi:hypothetical protein
MSEVGRVFLSSDSGGATGISTGTIVYGAELKLKISQPFPIITLDFIVFGRDLVVIATLDAFATGDSTFLLLVPEVSCQFRFPSKNLVAFGTRYFGFDFSLVNHMTLFKTCVGLSVMLNHV